MPFDPYFGGSQILPPLRPTTLPASTPQDVQRVANRQGGTVEQQVQSAIAQSGGAVIPLNNFSQGVMQAPVMDTSSQTSTIALVDDAAAEEVNAPGQVIPFDAMARRRLMGAPDVPTNALAVPAGPEDMMPLVDDGAMGAVEPEKKSNLAWWVAGAAILAVLWKFSQDSALQGAPLVAELDEPESEDEPQGSEE